MLALSSPHKLNAKLLAFIAERFYFTVSYWYQSHLQRLGICVNGDMLGDFQWNGHGYQT